jgi:hypothetical protein
VEFRICLLSHSADYAVTSDSAAAANLGIGGTPIFLLNGALVEESLTAEELKKDGEGATSGLAPRNTWSYTFSGRI